MQSLPLKLHITKKGSQDMLAVQEAFKLLGRTRELSIIWPGPDTGALSTVARALPQVAPLLKTFTMQLPGDQPLEFLKCLSKQIC